MPQDSSAFTSMRKGVALSNGATSLRANGPKANNVSGAIQYNVRKPAGFSRSSGPSGNITLDLSKGVSSGFLSFPSVTRIVVNVINAPPNPTGFSFATTQNIYVTSMISDQFADIVGRAVEKTLFISSSLPFIPSSPSFTVTLIFSTPITNGGVGMEIK
jgi:hypothetical protein